MENYVHISTRPGEGLTTVDVTYVRPRRKGEKPAQPCVATWTNFKRDVLGPLVSIHRAAPFGVEPMDRRKFRNTAKRLRRLRRAA
jgi:hypothetical protein